MMILMKVEDMVEEEMVEEDKDGYQLSSASIILAALDKSSLSVHSSDPAHHCGARRDNLSEKEYFLKIFFHLFSMKCQLTLPPASLAMPPNSGRKSFSRM